MELLKWKWVFLPTNAQSSAWNEQLWLRILTMISVTLRNSDAITTQLLIYIVETITYWLTIINILGGGVESGEFHTFWQKSLFIGNLFKIGGLSGKSPVMA